MNYLQHKRLEVVGVSGWGLQICTKHHTSHHMW